jgi:hypothetical protein
MLHNHILIRKTQNLISTIIIKNICQLKLLKDSTEIKHERHATTNKTIAFIVTHLKYLLF